VHFDDLPFSGAPGDDGDMIQWPGGYYMYIYSLRHFLTTKGALIDGDGYPPKNPKKGSKKGVKMIKN